MCRASRKVNRKYHERGLTPEVSVEKNTRSKAKFCSVWDCPSTEPADLKHDSYHSAFVLLEESEHWSFVFWEGSWRFPLWAKPYSAASLDHLYNKEHLVSIARQNTSSCFLQSAQWSVCTLRWTKDWNLYNLGSNMQSYVFFMNVCMWVWRTHTHTLRHTHTQT